MFLIRRLVWLGAGAFLGLWGRRKAVKTAERYVPQAVAERVKRNVTSTVRNLASDVGDARDQARATMQRREQELRSQHEP